MASGATAPAVEVWDDAAAVEAAFGDLEPDTTSLLAAVAAGGGRRRVRVWRAHRDGRTVAVLVCRWVCLDRWDAFVAELEPGAASALTPALLASPARRVSGPGGPMRGVLDGVGPVRSAVVQPLRFVPAPLPAGVLPCDARGRAATPADLDAVTRVVGSGRLELPPTPRRLRRFLARLIDAGAIHVIAEGDDVLAVARLDGATARFGWLTGLVVAPEHRTTGLAWPLVGQLVEVLRSQDRGLAWSLNGQNPMEGSRYPELPEGVMERLPPEPRSDAQDDRSDAARAGRSSISAHDVPPGPTARGR